MHALHIFKRKYIEFNIHIKKQIFMNVIYIDLRSLAIVMNVV